MEWEVNKEKDLKLYRFAAVGWFTALLFFISLFFYVKKPINYEQWLFVVIFILLTVILGALFTWKYYLADYHTPKKLRWDKEGIEMINVFDKRVKIPWRYVVTVKYYKQKIFGKWEEAYYVRYNIPNLFLFHKNRFWVSKDIGEKLYACWAKIKVKEEWGLREGDMDKFKISGGDE